MNRFVIIHYHEEADGWWADSPDIPGWTCAAATAEEVHGLSEQAIREFASGSVGEAIPNSTALRVIRSGSNARGDGSVLAFSVTAVPLSPERPWTRPPVVLTHP